MSNNELGYAGDISPETANEWMQSGAAVMIDVRSDAELAWVGFVPGAVPVAWKQWPGMTMNPAFDDAVRMAANGKKLCCCAAVVCDPSQLPSAPQSWALRPTTSSKASRATPMPQPIAASWAAGAFTVCPGSKADRPVCSVAKATLQPVVSSSDKVPSVKTPWCLPG